MSKKDTTVIVAAYRDLPTAEEDWNALDIRSAETCLADDDLKQAATA